MYCLTELRFPTEFCYERVSRNRDKTNFVISQMKVVIPRNSVLYRMVYFVLRNGRYQTEIARKRRLELGFPTEFCYERVSRNRDETNFVISQKKVVIPRNSVLHGMVYFLLRNGRYQTEITQKRRYYAKK